MYLDILVIVLIGMTTFTWLFYQINWTWERSVCKKLRMMMKIWITSISPKFNFKTRMKYGTRRKYIKKQEMQKGNIC